MVQPEDREDGAAVDTILKGKRQMKRKYGVVDYLRKHYPPPEGSGEVEVEFLEGYDSIEGPDGSMGFGVFIPTEGELMDLNGNQVIAVDFDGTLCKQAWPEIGEENEILIEHLKEQQAAGARLILWTNREGDLLEEAVEWCKAHGLTFDTVNANLPELIDLYKNDCRKINADIYIDDKAVNPVPYRHAAGMFGFNPYANPIDKAEFEKRRSNHVEKN